MHVLLLKEGALETREYAIDHPATMLLLKNAEQYSKNLSQDVSTLQSNIVQDLARFTKNVSWGTVGAKSKTIVVIFWKRSSNIVYFSKTPIAKM